MNQDNKNLLTKNFNDWAIFSIISNTKINEKPILGWKIVAGKKTTVEVIFHIVRKFRKEIVVRALSPQGRVQLGNLAAGAQKLNFYLPDDMVLFQTQVKQIEENGDVRVKIPKMIAQIDRRKNLRLFVESRMSASVDFLKRNNSKLLGQRFSKTCFDLSAGGVSFIISKIEKKFFQEGDSIEMMKLNLDEKEILCHGLVVSILDVEPADENGLMYRGVKVALNISKIRRADIREIESFIFRYIDFEQVV